MTQFRTYIIIILFVLAAVCGIAGINICNSNAKSILLNICSSAVIILMLELISYGRDKFMFSYLKGIYIRMDIFNENSELYSLANRGEKYSSMLNQYKSKGISKRVELKYLGNGKYSGTLAYLDGEAQCILNLNLNNRMIGTGSFQYNKDSPDMGSYVFQVDKTEKIIYIHHSNFLPSGSSRGYEIWKKDD